MVLGLTWAMRPSREDLEQVAHQVTRLLAIVGLLMLVPATAALLLREWHAAAVLVASAAITVALSMVVVEATGSVRRRRLTWANGAVSVALVWLIAPAFGTLPLWLAGHYGSLLDAYFDGMSALTTSGLALVLDLDRLPDSLNLWRHMMQFLGGQGIVIVTLSLAGSAAGNLSVLYAGEGRDEGILPNVVRTARFIARVSFTYLLVGTTALWAALLHAGMAPVRALLHALELMMAAFSTGGFAPMSTSVGYYHALSVELVLAVLMVAGATSFALHFHLWVGHRRELWRSSEFRTLVATIAGLTVLTVVGLARAGVYADVGSLLRKGAFTALSAHTSTGFAVTPGRAFVTQWGTLAPAMVVTAMAIGAMGSSTGGGIKTIRLTVSLKALGEEIRRLLLPESALVVSRYHAGRDRIIRDADVRAATLVGLLFLLTYLAGGIVGLAYGFEFEEAMFESTSATATIGLTSGLLGPATPAGLKWTYILQMWLGRLEFTACFVLGGYLLAGLHRRRSNRT